MDERGHRLRAIDSHGARHSPEYPPLIDRTLDSLDRDARTQRRSLFDLDTVTFIAELGEAGGWESHHYHGYQHLQECGHHHTSVSLRTETPRP
jgi:hypothetical protein